jgi:hypothetical protein
VARLCGRRAFVTRGTHFSRGQHAASFSRWTFLDHAGRAGAVVDQHMLAEPQSNDVLLARELIVHREGSGCNVEHE